MNLRWANRDRPYSYIYTLIDAYGVRGFIRL